MANDTLSFSWELKGQVEEQIKQANREAWSFDEAVKELNGDLSKLSADKIQKNITKNVNDAEKALYKLMEAREKAEKALGRNNALFNEGYGSFDTSKLTNSLSLLDNIVQRVMNIGAAASNSGTAVKNLLSSLSADLVIRDVKSGASTLDKQIDKQYKERAKAEKEAAKEAERSEKEAENAAHRNAAAQDRVRDAIAKIATARANLTAASEKGNQEETTHLRLLISLLDRLSQKLNGLKGSFLGEKGALDGVLGSGYKGLMRNVSAAIKNMEELRRSNLENEKMFSNLGIRHNDPGMQNMQTALDGLMAKLAKVREDIDLYRHAIGTGSRESIDFGQKGLREAEAEAESLMRQYTALYNAMQRLRAGGNEQQPMAALRSDMRSREELERLNESYRHGVSRLQKLAQQEDAAAERSAQASRKRAQASAENKRNLNREAEAVAKLRLEMLKAQAVQLQGLIKNGKGTFNASQIEQYKNALRDVVHEITTLKGVMANIGSFTGRNGSGLMGFASGTNYSPMINYGQQTLEASRALNVLTDSERRFVESLSQTTAGLRNQGVLLSDLKMMATQYLSLWGARSFLNSIIETGGLLEQQRLSIGAILGSMDKANVVFGKIKDLAVKSPFGVVELDKMSKQLTAYGFQYEELFDWTKRLADISAATGTEVSRLALALGHVRAEGALSGYTLRQFAMANVPLLQNLANNLGITTKEVRERTKKKEIGYDDVKKVLEDLTDEGGMFYNAQEVMSQALNAKFKNLRDAFDIMYGEIAESGVGDLLKGIAEALTAGAKEWKRFGTDLLWVASAFGVVKAATAAYASGMMVLRKQLGVLALNTKAFTAEQVQQMLVNRQITREQLLRAVATGKLTVEQAKLAASTINVSAAELREVATSKIVKASLLGNAIATSKLTMAELRHLAVLRQTVGVGGSLGRFFTSMVVGFQGVGTAIKAAGAALRSFLPFLAIGAIVDIFSRWSQQKDAARDAAQESASAITAGLSDVKSLYDTLSKKGTDDVAASVESMKEQLKEIGAYSGIKDQVESTKDLKVQYDILYGRLEELSKGYEKLKASCEAYIEAANRVGGGVLSDNMKKDIEQFGETFISNNVAKTSAGRFADIYTKELVKKLKSDGKWVESKMKNMEWFDLLKELGGYGHQVLFAQDELKPSRYFWDSDEVSIEKERYHESAAALMEYIETLGKLNAAREEVESHMPAYAAMIKDMADTYVQTIGGLDPKNMASWGDDEFKVYTDGLRKHLETLKVPEEVRTEIRDMIIDTFPKEIQTKLRVAFDRKTETEELTGWHKEIQDYFDKNGIQIKLTASDSIQSVEKKLQEARKKAQEKMDSMGAILTYWKIKPDLSAIDDFAKKHPIIGAFIKGVFGDYKQAKEEMERIDKAHTDTGLAVTDPKKDKKSKKSGSNADKALEDARTRLSEIKAFLQEYKKYQQRYGMEDAIKILENLFPNLKGQGYEIVNNYDAVLDRLRGSLKATTDARKKFITDVDKTKADALWDRQTEDLKKNLSVMEEYIKRMTDSWKLYNSLLEKSGGNREFAELAFRDGFIWDDIAKNLLDRFNERGNELGIGQIAFSWDMNEEELREVLKNTSGVTQDEMVKLAKSIQDTIRGNYKQLLEDGAEAYKKSLTEVQKLSELEGQLQKRRNEKAGYNGVNPAVIAAYDAIIAGLEKQIQEQRWNAFKEQNDWGRVFGDLGNMSLETIERLAGAMEKLDLRQLSVEDMKAWQEGMQKLIDKMLELNPEKGITRYIKEYSDALTELKDTKIGGLNLDSGQMSRLLSGEMSQAEMKRLGVTKADIDAYLKALDKETKALNMVYKALGRFGSLLKEFGSGLSELGNAIGGNFGDTLSGFGSMFSSLGDGVNALSKLQAGQTGIGAVVSKVNVAMAALSAIITLNKTLDEMLPSTDKLFEHQMRKLQEMNKLTHAIDDYAIAVAKASSAERDWFYSNDLSALRSRAEEHKSISQAYWQTLTESQAAYKNRGSGLKKWALPIGLAIGAAVVGVMTGGFGLAGAITAGLSALGVAAGTALGTATLTAATATLSAGIGAAVGTAIRAGVDQITYSEGQRAAYENLRIQTRHASFWRGQKTADLRDWVKEKFGKDLFTTDRYGIELIDVELGKTILEKYGDALQGQTRETLERLVELGEEYKEFMESVRDYVSDAFSPLADNMTDSLWEWLNNGRDMMDSFKEYASDTFKSIAQDAVKAFLKVMILDKFKEQLEDLFTLYSVGGIDEAGLMQSVAVYAGAMSKEFEALIPTLQNLGTVMNEAFQAAGFDVIGEASSENSASNTIKGVTETTADLMASYINAIRADVSVNRVTLQGILVAVQTQTEMPVIARAQLQQLEMIARSTATTAANTEAINEIFAILHANVLGANSFNMK